MRTRARFFRCEVKSCQRLHVVHGITMTTRCLCGAELYRQAWNLPRVPASN